MLVGTKRVVMAMALLVCGCHRADDGGPVAASTDGAAPGSGPSRHHAKPPTERKAAVVLTPPGGTAARVGVEVVRSQQEVRRGLMYRQHLPADQGMLFLMDREMVHTFWMKNTLIPLDMIFIAKEMVVAGVVENTEPMTTRQYYVDSPSLFVLEVNAGWARAHGVAAGAAVSFEHVEPR